MTTTTIGTIPFGTYAAGTYHMPATDVGQTSTSFTIAITRTSFPNTTAVVASISIEGSDDAGRTWQSLGGITLVGGVVNLPPLLGGGVATESVYTASFDNSKPASYQLRGTAVLFQQLTTGARLTVS